MSDEREVKIPLMPLLSIVPIPSLSVEPVSIDFDMEVKKSEQSGEGTDVESDKFFTKKVTDSMERLSQVYFS